MDFTCLKRSSAQHFKTIKSFSQQAVQGQVVLSESVKTSHSSYSIPKNDLSRVMVEVHP